MKKIVKKKYEYVFYIIILVIFISLVTLISFKHEYWADEANAWLIASDSSLIQLFTKYLHADGHPALFHLIIKFFRLFGLNYENFRIISILFSSLGVAFFLFKSNYKWYLKALLPFTFFIFYQYTVVTRGYCMILMLLSFIADIWKKKKENCILFSFLLILLLSLESYTFFLAGSIYLLYIIEYINDYKKNKSHNKKLFVCLVIIFIVFLITTIYVMPRSTNTFNPRNTIYYLSDSFITSFNMLDVLKKIVSLLVYFLFVYLGLKNKNKGLELIILIVPLFCFMCFRYCNLWHTGIMFLVIIFIGWIHEYNKYKLFNIFMLLTCFIQIYWSFSSSLYDFKESYSPSKEVADFIKEYDYKNMKIYGWEFYESAINAYFDKNIFDNWDKNTRHFYWDINNIYYSLPIDVDSLVSENVDMVIITPVYETYDVAKMRKYYDEYQFDGSTYFQVDKYESMKAYVYVRNKIGLYDD